MTMNARFSSTCGRCKQQIVVGQRIEWERGTAAIHANAQLCAVMVQAAAEQPKVEMDLKPVADFINAAKGRGLKFPKVSFLLSPTQTVTLSVAGEQSKAPGAVQVKMAGVHGTGYYENKWVGRVTVAGMVEGPLAGAQYANVREALKEIAADPAKAAKEYAALTGACSFCNTGLTDEGSIEVGYGPVCAKRFGLPHKPKGSKVVGESPVALFA